MARPPRLRIASLRVRSHHPLPDAGAFAGRIADGLGRRLRETPLVARSTRISHVHLRIIGGANPASAAGVARIVETLLARLGGIP
jgi:hypothetical protein